MDLYHVEFFRQSSEKVTPSSVSLATSWCRILTTGYELADDGSVCKEIIITTKTADVSRCFSLDYFLVSNATARI